MKPINLCTRLLPVAGLMLCTMTLHVAQAQNVETLMSGITPPALPRTMAQGTSSARESQAQMPRR